MILLKNGGYHLHRQATIDINLKNTVDGVPVSQLPTIIFYHQKLYLKIMRIINLFKRQQHLFHNNLLPKADINKKYDMLIILFKFGINNVP